MSLNSFIRPAGQLTETCVITLTPITDKNGQPAVEEVKKCSLAYDSGTGASATTSGTTFTASPIAGNTASPSSKATSVIATVTASTTSSISSTQTSSVTVAPSVTNVATSSGISSTPTSILPAIIVNGLTTVTGLPTQTQTGTTSAVVGTTTSVTGSNGGIADSTPTSSPPGIIVNGITTVTGIPTQIGTTFSGGTAAADSTANPSGATAAAAAESPSESASAAFQLPGKTLSVLPIGLGVFAGISVIALIVVGLVTYERTKYRKAFRQRKLAESGANMGYGGMA
ncbi:hypothetical protein C0991_001662 [Blastosporella zonata]|nr:hypothetical protein C0991_001662 [Blastosporella zonata]